MTDDKLQLLRLGYLADIFFKMKKSEPITSRKTNGSIYCQNVEFSSKTQNFGTLISNIFHRQLPKLKGSFDENQQ